MSATLPEIVTQALAQGVPPNQLAEQLVSESWPEKSVNDAIATQVALQNQTLYDSKFKAWLKRYYRMARPAVVVVVGLNLVDTAIALLKPWPVKIMADSVFGQIPAWGPLGQYTGTVTLLLITSLMTVSLFIIGALFAAFRDFFLLKIGFGLNRAIKEESLRHILHLPLFHRERLSKGDYVYRQNTVTSSLSDLALGTTSSIIQSILVMVGVLIIMLLINPGLTLIAVLLLPLLFISIRYFGPKMGYWARKYTENASETASRVNESIDNAEAVQAFTLEEKMVKNINHLWLDSYHYTKKNMVWGQWLDGLNGLLVTVATSAVMLVGGAAALNAEVSFGDLLIFMTYMGYLIGPVQQLIDQVTSRNQKLIDVSRIFEVMTDHEGIEYLRQDQPMPAKIDGNVEFQNVTYAYNGEVVFSNLSLSIPAGQKVAIIGPSGGGKSTILKLLPLFVEPEGGQITIDGTNIQSVSLKQLRKRIAWVSQTPQLFDENIFENLLEGDVDRPVSDEEMANAVEVSNISEFVLKMPLAFETSVGENGGSLSGGQRQRLSIARALIKNAPIICLDEPTAALDIKSENYIRDSLAQMVKGKTVLMVTHRKPLLALMDIIYVLDNGRLRNVSELGGLDSYLAQLEGFEQKQAEQAIAKEETTAPTADFMARMAGYFTAYQQTAIDQQQPTDQQPEKSAPLAETPAEGTLSTNENDDTEVDIDLHHES